MTTLTRSRILPELEARGYDVQAILGVLNDQQAHKIDLVAPLDKLAFLGGNLVIQGRAPELTEDGFFDVNGLYRPIGGVHSQISSILDIPKKYMDKLATEDINLLDHNLNELIKLAVAKRPEQKQLVRLLWGEDQNYPGSAGVFRALLSDRYAIYDNLDTLLAVLDGLRAAGLGIEHIKSIDLSHNRLYLSVRATEINALAPELLAGYRSPFSGASGTDNPVVDAGVEFSNSEVGSGAFQIRPVIWVQVCSNGLVQKRDALRKVHLGGRLEEGTINWSAQTRDAANKLVREQVKDATESFLTPEYVQGAVNRMTEEAGIELAKPDEVIKQVARELVYTQAEQDTILSHFIKGGQITSGGILQAVSSAAQTITDVDRAHEFLGTAVDAMKVAARIAS
jgi:hypothetical protein